MLSYLSSIHKIILIQIIYYLRNISNILLSYYTVFMYMNIGFLKIFGIKTCSYKTTFWKYSEFSPFIFYINIGKLSHSYQQYLISSFYIFIISAKIDQKYSL